MPYMMENGEAEIVAQRLLALMGKRLETEFLSETQFLPGSSQPAVNVAGQWTIETAYSLGSSVHTMTLKQDGAVLSGDYRSQFAWTTVRGSVSGNEVAFTAAIRYEASGVEYAYRGVVEGDTMRGSVDMGEYFAAAWVAHRLTE
jgi:hypothetical protein